MKKPKIKPEVVWMAHKDKVGFHISLRNQSWTSVIYMCENATGIKWNWLRKNGWRIVKVRISECK